MTEPERPEVPEETGFRRGLRRGRHSAMYVSLLILIAAGVFLILLIARNTRRVKLDYVFGSSKTALIWLIVVSAITGWVLGIATSYLVRRRMRRDS